MPCFFHDDRSARSLAGPGVSIGRFRPYSGDTDLGAAVLEAGLGDARYDGLDGYDQHPLQDAYRSIDAVTATLCG